MTSTIGTTQLKIVFARRVSIAPASRCDGIIATNTQAHINVSWRSICLNRGDDQSSRGTDSRAYCSVNGVSSPLRLRVASFERLGLNVSATAELLSAPEIGTDIRGQVEPVHVANLFYSGRTGEALELATTIRPELPLRNLSQAIALSLWSRVILETGERWTELAVWMTSALENGVRLGDRAAAGQAAYSLACLHFSAGRYIDAGRLVAEAEVLLEYHDPVGLLPVADAMQVGVACFSNDSAAIGPALNRCRARVGEAGPLAHQQP